MKQAIRRMDTGIRWLEDVISAVTLLAIVCIATASVIARYGFHTGVQWADEVNQALLVAMGMFGSARAVRMGGHTEFTAVSTKPKSRKVRIAIRGTILAITMAFLIFLLVITIQYTANGVILSTVLRVPRMYYYVSIPLGFALCIYEYLKIARHKVLDDPQPEQSE